MIEKRQFYIDGKWVDPIAGTECDVIDPSTEESCAVISLGGQADTDAAVAAAKAFETYAPAWNAATRSDVVKKWSPELGVIFSDCRGCQDEL